MQKPTRKNSHKERIFSSPQNKVDFNYQNEHQDKAQELLEKAGVMSAGPKMKKPSGKRVKIGRPLTAQQAKASLKNITGWRLSNNSKMIYREFIIKDFISAIDLVNRIAEIAEDVKHHPNILLTDYRKLRVELTSHDVGGLSEDDFSEAGQINDLPVELKR